MSGFVPWTPSGIRELIAVPGTGDDKYSRGVLGVVTGSDDYPGAAVLGVDAALHTGVGMVRYLGPTRVAPLVVSRRPEVVTVDGRVQAWLIGSGMEAGSREPLTESRIATALGSGDPVVLDAGAMGLAGESLGPVVITPHRGELARLLGVDVAEISTDPESWVERAAKEYGATVILKGHTTLICGAGGKFSITAPTTWLATAGTGDALAGVLGAFVASHAADVIKDDALMSHLAAAAVFVHGRAGQFAGAGGPFTVLDLNAALPAVIAGLLK